MVRSSVKYSNTSHKEICCIDLRRLFITQHNSNYLLSCSHLKQGCFDTMLKLNPEKKERKLSQLCGALYILSCTARVWHTATASSAAMEMAVEK